MPDAALKHITKPQTPFKMLLHWMQPRKKKLQTLYVLHVTYFDTPAVDLIRVIVGHTSPLHKTQVLYIYRVNKNVVVSWYEVITLEMMMMATIEGLSVTARENTSPPLLCIFHSIIHTLSFHCLFRAKVFNTYAVCQATNIVVSQSDCGDHRLCGSRGIVKRKWFRSAPPSTVLGCGWLSDKA